jgi:hypothetical protein
MIIYIIVIPKPENQPNKLASNILEKILPATMLVTVTIGNQHPAYACVLQPSLDLRVTGSQKIERYQQARIPVTIPVSTPKANPLNETDAEIKTERLKQSNKDITTKTSIKLFNACL